MDEQHQPNWREAGTSLQAFLEEYRALKGFENLSRAIDEVANSMPGRGGWGISNKTARRDMAGKQIPDRRVELYVQWLHEKARLSYERLAEWLEYTSYPRPGELLARICNAEGDRQKVFNSVKRNGVPSLRGRLWGRYLERQVVLEKAIQWADNRRHPIAVLWGYGGNGKTTIQLKIGEDFVYGSGCPLRWPYEGVVWVSAQDFPRGQPSLLDVLRKIVEAFELVDDPANLERVSPAWLKQEAERLLRKKRVLVLLDNFETVSLPNREEILKYFSWLSGSTQTLISSRYHLDMRDIAHVLIPVDGLLPAQAAILIDDYLKARSLSTAALDPNDLKRLAEVTSNNPKTIIAVLGLVEKGIALSDLLTSISTGSPEADAVFDRTIDEAWKDLLSETDKAVLMAKSFFSQPVGELALGQVAGVNEEQLSHAISMLQTISFFDRPQSPDTRVRTHPLAQDFARRILRDHPDFESRAEERWWMEYAPRVVDQARRATYTDLQAKHELADDVMNVLGHLEEHLVERTPYTIRAAEMFGSRDGLGNALCQLDEWDEVLRVAELVFRLAIDQGNARLIGECALNLISMVYRERNELDKAEMYVAEATEQNVTLANQWLEAAIVLEQAQIYRRRGRFKAAKQTFQKALDMFLKLDDMTDIATTVVLLSGITMAIATADTQESVDPQWREKKLWAEVEEYFRQAEHYLSLMDANDPVRRFDAVTIRAYRGTAARVRGDLDEAHRLFTGCSGQFQSLTSTARLYRELALVEHLSGNKELAYEYEDHGLNLQRQLGNSENLQPYDCYRHIDRMKKEGTW
jgi:tetratricopeptide (TPR) repeat protein